MKTKYILFSIITLTNVGCKIKNEKKNIAVSIDHDSITLNQLDNIIKQEIYDYLVKIYELRQVAANEIIKDNIYEKEAKEMNISKDSLVSLYFDSRITSANLNQYIRNNGVVDPIPILKGGILRYVPLNSAEGQESLKTIYKNYLIEIYMDSLKKKYHVEIYLKEPAPLITNNSNIQTHMKGNVQSKVSLLLISDLDCFKCRETEPLYEMIFQKYKNEICFKEALYTDDVSLSAMGAESAARQGKFWEMKKLIMESKLFPDTSQIFSFANQLNLNMDQFNSDINDPELKNEIEMNVKKIKAAGYYGTPTVVINNKIVLNSFSADEISKSIDSELAN